MTRVYVPASPHLLAGWHRAGSVRAAGAPERVLAASEGEDDEHAALVEAAADSAALVGAGARRVVVVAETAADVDGDLPWRDVVAVHADLAGEAGPPSTGRRDEVPAWVAVQEVGRLVDGSL